VVDGRHGHLDDVTRLLVERSLEDEAAFGRKHLEVRIARHLKKQGVTVRV